MNLINKNIVGINRLYLLSQKYNIKCNIYYKRDRPYNNRHKGYVSFHGRYYVIELLLNNNNIDSEITNNEANNSNEINSQIEKFKSFILYLATEIYKTKILDYYIEISNDSKVYNSVAHIMFNDVVKSRLIINESILKSDITVYKSGYTIIDRIVDNTNAINRSYNNFCYRLYYKIYVKYLKWFLKRKGLILKLLKYEY